MTGSAGEPAVLARPLRQKRKPGLMALGVALVVIGAMAAWFLVTRASGTVQAVGLRGEVQRGAVISASDVVLTEVPRGTSLPFVPGDEIDEVVGKVAQVELAPGLLRPTEYGPALVPQDGMAIVGVVPNLAPQQALHAGDRVRMVFTPPPSGDLPEALRAWTATVVRTGPAGGTGGGVLVDVEVAETEADAVLAAAATGRLAVALVPVGQK